LIHAAQGIEQENGEHMLRLGNETNLGRANRRLNLVGKANLGADTGTETRKTTPAKLDREESSSRRTRVAHRQRSARKRAGTNEEKESTQICEQHREDAKVEFFIELKQDSYDYRGHRPPSLI
jgi:hypothetical protein